jgi:alanine or glycine:cation symporter, AGCS family
MDILNFLVDFIWSKALVYLCLGAGIYFSVRTRFLQIRHFKDMIKYLVGGGDSRQGVSSFQAFALSVAGRVGIGNIAGVATAIAMGGPGAVFWMWAIAFLGAGTSFVECALGQVYKEEINGEYRGGPAYYVEKGLGQKWFAVILAIAIAVSMGLLFPGIQSNSMASTFNNVFGVSSTTTGIGIVILLGIIIFGGVKRISKAAQIIVPFMALGYIIVALVLMIANIAELPRIFALIIKSAFGFDQAFAGIVGYSVSWGVKRGIYSNEAGQGTGPQSAAAAEVAHPAIQGLVQAFAVYVDTLLVCSATAFMILFTDSYNVHNPAGGFIVENLPGIEYGPAFTQKAVETIFPSFGGPFVAVAIFFFAFTTLMAYYYIAETNIAYLVKGTKNNKIVVNILRVVLLASTFYGSIKTADFAWALGDLAIGIMGWLNAVAILLLGNIGLKVLKDYEEQKKQGKELKFDPIKLGIKNADLWLTINDRRAKGLTHEKQKGKDTTLDT